MRRFLKISVLVVPIVYAIVIHAEPAHPGVILPRGERILLWTPQERPIGFRSMQKISPGREVKRGRSVYPLRYASNEVAIDYTYNGRRWDTEAYMEQNDVAGLLILKNGRVVLEKYALGFDETGVWTSFSVAKSLTSTLLGAAIADGHIKNVDELVVQYLPALKGSGYDGVTLRHVLNMTSGVRWNEDYDNPESDVNRAHRSTDASLGSPLVTYLAKLPREAGPGTKWAYKTAETDLAGEIVIAATGKPLAQYLSEKIWSVFGMERSAYWMLRGGKELGGCCLSMSLRDYARFALFFLDGGKAAGKRVLPEGWITQATTATPASRKSMEGGAGYGYQWWIGTDGPDTFAARGIFGQGIYMDPKEKLIIITLSAWPTPLDRKRREAGKMFQQVVTESLRHP